MSDHKEVSPPAGLTGWICRPGRFYKTQANMNQALGVETGDQGPPLDYDELPSVVWDGVSPLALYESDIVFWTRDQVDVFCREAGLVIGELELVHLHPIQVFEVVPEMICPSAGDLPFPSAVIAAIHHLNELVKEAGPFGWVPVPVAAIVVE